MIEETRILRLFAWLAVISGFIAGGLEFMDQNEFSWLSVLYPAAGLFAYALLGAFAALVDGIVAAREPDPVETEGSSQPT